MAFRKLVISAVLTVAASLAFAGGASASTTALCTVHVEGACPAVYTGHIEGLAINLEILSNLANITCEHSVILGTVLGLASGSSGKAVAHIELFDASGHCRTSNGTNCTFSAVALGLVDILRVELNLGLYTSLGNSMRIVCLGVINCTFGGEPQAHIEGSSGSSLGQFVINESPLTGNGLLCPEVGKWDALYRIELPHTLFIAQ